jgi:hypothetical protein
MRDRYFPKALGCFRCWPVWLLLLLMVFGGCQAKEPPLSPAAASFKKEVRDYLQRLSRELAAPLAKGDLPAINEVLDRVEPEAVKLCRMCPFHLGVLNKNGETLTVHPFKADALGNFSNYEVVVKTLKDQKINQQRFFLQDGSQIYIVCDPILQGDQLLGILALGVSAQEAKQRWGLTEQEFMTINFNNG